MLPSFSPFLDEIDPSSMVDLGGAPPLELLDFEGGHDADHGCETWEGDDAMATDQGLDSSGR